VLELVDQQAFAIVKEGIYFVRAPDAAGRHSIQFFNFATNPTSAIFERILANSSPSRR
jgi:hypothetical protein